MSVFVDLYERDSGSPVGGDIAVSQVPGRVHEILANVVLELYGDPNNLPDDHVLQTKLIRPLEATWRAKEILTVLQSNLTASNFCGKVFKNGEPAVFCKDCQTDPTCCLCLECFENSEHKNHNYRMFASGGGGCCDCGDPEAWTTCVYCDNHKPSEDNKEQIDPIANLPSSLGQYAHTFLSTVLWYCMKVINWEKDKTLPQELCSQRAQTILEKDSFVAMLMNDEVHTYDQVINGLHRHVGLTHPDAVNLATLVDRKGRGFLWQGTEVECDKAKTNLNKSLTHFPLNVKIFHSAILSHQNAAIFLLNFLKDLAEKSDGFCRLLSIAMIEPILKENNQCILDQFFLKDNSIWIEVRLAWHRLIMSSIFKDFEYKKYLAISLCKNYSVLAKNFIEDTHHHDVCAINLTVQLFTVTSLSRMLVVEHNLLEQICNTIRDIVRPFWNNADQCLNLHSRNYKHERIGYILCDLRYVLRNKPDEWTDQMRVKTYEGFKSFVELLTSLENMDAVKRQHGSHVDMEPNWENSFNFTIILQMAILLFLDWCISDQQVLVETVHIALKKQLEISRKFNIKQHNVDQQLVGRKGIDLVLFDMLKEKMSFHHPLARFIAGLLSGASRYNLSLVQLLRISPTETQVPLRLMESCTRSVVLSSQVLSGMWKRNGYGVLNQAIHYQYQLGQDVMYNKDIIMLQSMAAILDPNMFVYALIYKFRLDKWLIKPEADPKERKEHGEDALRFLIMELEDFLFLLIVIFGERYSPGIGEGVTIEDSLRRQLIHLLYFGPQAHSQIIKKLKDSENEKAINQIIKEIASLRRISNKSVFELKEEYVKFYDPFYYHYSKVEQSQAEEVWRKHLKVSGGANHLAPSAPCCPPPFSVPYQGVLRLMQCPVLIRVLHNIFRAAVNETSKFWSVRLLHECLHLSALMLVEEQKKGQTFFRRGCLGLDGKSPSLLPHLEALKSTSRVEERQHLLLWVLKELHQAKREATGMSDSPPMSRQLTQEVEEVDLPSPTNRRQLLAEEHRKRIMEQITEMQRKFYEQHKEELELIDAEPIKRSKNTDNPDDLVSVSAVSIPSLLNQTSSPVGEKCILCQEEVNDITMETGKTFVLSACVQRSSVLRRCQPSINSKLDYLSGLLDTKWGIFTGGCGHVMHYVCWHKYIENKQHEHSRNYFFPIPGHSVKWQNGEYLCPLCQTFGNAVLPLANPLQHRVQLIPPACQVTLEKCRELIDAAVNRGCEITSNNEAGSCVDLPEFNCKLKVLFPQHEIPIIPLAQVPWDNSQLEVMEGLFTQTVFMQGFASPPDENNENIPLAQWQNCAFTIAGLEHSARNEGKFLLDTLSDRQLKCVSSLIQLGWQATKHVETSRLADNITKLLNILLPPVSAFSEQPSILEMDIFTLLVNLHFNTTALMNRLTSSQPQQPEMNPILVPLVGIIDEYLVAMATAVQMMQYFLSSSPGMEISPSREAGECEEPDAISPELEEGFALQNLWCQIRHYACPDLNDPPPSPYSLYVGMQEHLYPFLQSTALFFRCLTGINFVHSSASEASNFTDLCKYLSLPVSLSTIFDNPIVKKLSQNLCAHSKLAEDVQKNTPTLAIQPTRRLIEIPERYSELIKRASKFRCPKTNLEVEDSQTAMLCLLCGEMICSNSYCCQTTLPDDETVKVGGLTQHTQLCGGGFGIAIWVLECYVVLLDATDLHNVRGCTLTPPYIDEYGEPDPGLRRGSPLKFNPESYKELQQCWLNHQLPERICKEMEHNMKLMRIKWANM